MPIRKLQNQNWRHPARQGFSLMEMMVVLGVVGVAGAMAIPQVSQQVTTARLERSVADLVGYLRQAREDESPGQGLRPSGDGGPLPAH